MSSREAILDRLKKSASRQGKSRVIAPITVVRGDVELFMQKAALAGAQVERVADLPSAASKLQELLAASSGKAIISSSEKLIKDLNIPGLCPRPDMEYHEIAALDPAVYREMVLKAEIGITACDYALADTGSLVICHSRINERLLSLAPHHYIGLVQAERILLNRFSLAAAIHQDYTQVPAALTIITGVSRTADVALQVVLGMHGPRKVDLIVIG